MQRAGFTELPAKLPRNNGFDGVWVKKDAQGNVTKIIITESKFASNGNGSLATTKTMDKQLSPEWIQKNITKMLNSKDPTVVRTAQLLNDHKHLPNVFGVKAAVIDSAGNQRFNKIKVPDITELHTT